MTPDDGLSADAFRPVAPAYGRRSLAELLPSVSALLGVPGARDVLGLSEQLAGVDRVAVLVVDGLGAYQIPQLRTHAPILADPALGDRTLTSGFPSTTPVSLVTLGTGARPGEHGVLGLPYVSRVAACSSTSGGATTRTRTAGSRCRRGWPRPLRPGLP